jgi:hypothetical protein
LAARDYYRGMSASKIGVQRIRPQSGATWQCANPAPDVDDDSDGDDAPAKRDRAPRPPEAGRIVDKIA